MRSTSRSALGALTLALALSGLTAASALAVGAPTVETKPATALGATKATLNGTVNPNGGTGNTYYFEYGTTTSYGSATSKYILVSGNEAVKVSRAITGLASNTTYHFRIVATNKTGTSDGSDEVFTTLPEKPEFSAKAGEKLTQFEYRKIGLPVTDWETSSGFILPCENEGSSFQGKILGTKTVSGKIIFAQCVFANGKCQSEGAKAGEIATVELEGTLVYISKATKSVGIDFKPKSGEVLTKFKDCFEGQVTGSIIVPVSPVNKLTEKFGTGTLRENRGIQEITQYENEVGEIGHGSLSTTWPTAENVSLGWGLAGFSYETNKQIEIKA